MRAALLLAVLLAAGCAGRTAPLTPGAIPAIPAMGAGLPAGRTDFANDDLAELFTRLTLDMEWGASRPNLVRFEAPVRVALEGDGAGPYRDFTARLLAMVGGETGLDIALAGAAATANLHVRFVDGPAMARVLPSQACVIATGDLGWELFVTDPERYGTRRHVEAERLDAATIFIPRTSPPYQIRRCLMEEILQALGPANDLFGVADTIFNDDGAHGWPTRLDLLMLRVLYSPDMRTGLDRAETRARARALLAALNPEGERPGAARIGPRDLTDPDRWVALNIEAHRADGSLPGQARAAREALELIARRERGSIRHCYSLGELADLDAPTNRDGALALYREAERVCTAALGAGDIRVARLRLQRATLLLWNDRYADTIALLEPLVAVFAANGRETALARLYAVLGTAYLETGDDARAAEALELARQWGGYAFGTDDITVRTLAALIGG